MLLMVLPSLTGLMSDTTDGGAAPGRITGISFSQVDYVSGDIKYTNTDTGRLEVNMEVLKRATGLDSGYINGYTSAGWVIKNLPFFEYSPYERKVAYFNLSSTGDVRTLGIHLEVSQDIKARFTTGTMVSYTVFNTVYHIEGNSDGQSKASLKAPGPTKLEFNPAGWTEVYYQYNHHPLQNVQTAVNQCVPAGMANNFQYLEDTFGIDIEHDHVMGIGFKGNETVVPENSLVGTLDVYTRRNVTDRLTGGGVSVKGMLNATLDYIDDYDLPLESRHQGEFGDECYSHESSDVFSMGEGGIIDWEWVMEEVKYGHGVTLRFWRYDNGEHVSGHQIETTAAGFIGGVPYLEFCHDEDQSDDFTGLVAEATFLDFNESFDHWMMVDDPYPADKDGPSHIVHALSLEAQNQAPSTPEWVSGDMTPESGTPSVYGFVSEDPENHLVYYKVDWGDGEYSDWLGPKGSGEICLAEHTWEFGFYEARVKARDHFWLESDWKYLYIAIDIIEIAPWIDKVLQLDLLPYVNTLGGALDTKLDGAIGHMVSSLDPELWTDSAHLDPQHGHRVFAEHKAAVKKLQELMGHKGVPDSMLNAGRRAVGMLALMDGLLAGAAVEDAIAGGAEGKKAVHQLDLAQGGIDAGHADMLAGDYDSSIDSNRAAWGHAQLAMG